MPNFSASESLYAKARNLMPGGVNSPVRAWQAVGGTPLLLARGEGPRIYDLDGNSFLDYVASWGPLILGHAHPRVVAAVQEAAARGTSFGAPTPLEVELAELLCQAVPSLEMVRLVTSGTEACMSALRLARAATGRPLVVKFDGCYHGHADTLLVDAGSGVATLAIPGSPGVPEAVAALTLSLPYNDLEAVERVMKTRGGDVACIIVEPVAGNMGLVAPVDGFLSGLRDLCSQYGSILIFDEVMTGFRVAYGGAQALFNVMGRQTQIQYVAMPESLQESYQYFTHASMERLKKAGCPLHFRSLEDAVRDYVVNHLQAEDPHLCLLGGAENTRSPRYCLRAE